MSFFPYRLVPVSPHRPALRSTAPALCARCAMRCRRLRFVPMCEVNRCGAQQLFRIRRVLTKPATYGRQLHAPLVPCRQTHTAPQNPAGPWPRRAVANGCGGPAAAVCQLCARRCADGVTAITQARVVVRLASAARSTWTFSSNRPRRSHRCFAAAPSPPAVLSVPGRRPGYGAHSVGSAHDLSRGSAQLSR